MSKPTRNELLEQILLATGGVPVGQENYYTEVGRFVENASQPGAGLDVLDIVTLGPAGSDSEGILTVAANGEVTVNKAGPLMIKQTFQLAKESNPGNLEAFFHAEISTDGGTIWTALGTSVNRRIANDATINVFFDISPIFLPAGVMIRNRWAKSSVGGDPLAPTVGVNDGSLLYTAPSAALLAAGMEASPSAQAVVYKLNGFTYV